jgi:hypothetical protein
METAVAAAIPVAEIVAAPIPSMIPEMASVSSVVTQVEQPAFASNSTPAKPKYNITIMPEAHCDGCE